MDTEKAQGRNYFNYTILWIKNDRPIYSNPIVVVVVVVLILGIVLFGLQKRKTSELSWLLDITKHYRANEFVKLNSHEGFIRQ